MLARVTVTLVNNRSVVAIAGEGILMLARVDLVNNRSVFAIAGELNNG
jgi:hypothetical protein